MQAAREDAAIDGIAERNSPDLNVRYGAVAASYGAVPLKSSRSFFRFHSWRGWVWKLSNKKSWQ